MQTKHETLLVISIIDDFLCVIKNICETFNLSEYFQDIRENTNISTFSRQKHLETFLTSAKNAT